MEEMGGEEATESKSREGCSGVPAGDVTKDVWWFFHALLNYVWWFFHVLLNHVSSVVGGIDGRDGKRGKNIDIGHGSGPTVSSGVYQSQSSGEESQISSSSRQPTETAWDTVVLDNCGGRRNMQHVSSLQLEGVKHKIFISHSRAQKDFAEQLCVDLERQGYMCPFFDLRQHSLPKGKDFVPLIKEAARHCYVAVIVLSEEFLCSKWPMIELAEFHGAQQAGNPRLNMLPLFYKLLVEDLGEKAIEERWMPKWRQLADEDARIIVADWIGAVRALRSANGVVFEQRGMSKVGYRKDIVRSIFRMSPPDLLYGSSRKMVGYSRVCKGVRDRFVRGSNGGPSYLGLYGVIGVGKTTLSKALCEQFCGEYTGRVCHVDMGEGQHVGKAWNANLNVKFRLRRMKRMLERLCELDKGVVDRIIDVDEGLAVMKRHMEREPVFLAIDNVTNENRSWSEVCDYLSMGFHPESRILFTSRSKENISDLVPEIPFCVPMPSLTVTEAGELFLRSAAPSMSIFGLTAKEQRIIGICIQQCMFYDLDQCGVATSIGEDEDGLLFEVHAHNLRGKSFHPIALSTLGVFFYRYFPKGDILRWSSYLEESKDPLQHLWEFPNGIGGVFGLQFHSLSSSNQLLFLDIAFNPREYWPLDFLTLLCKLHEETQPLARELQNLERCGMIKLRWKDNVLDITMYEVYIRFAQWYMRNHGVKWLKNAWCVFESQGYTSNGSNVALSDLVRLRMVDISLASAKVLASKRMQELHNLEVLWLESCDGMRELNLEGLVSLQYLEVVRMQNLETVRLNKYPTFIRISLCPCLELLRCLDCCGGVKRSSVKGS